MKIPGTYDHRLHGYTSKKSSVVMGSTGTRYTSINLFFRTLFQLQPTTTLLCNKYNITATSPHLN